MHEKIVSLAKTISGAEDAEESLLELLCTSAEQAWEKRLREGITVSDCEEPFACAAALCAVAGLLTGRAARDSFSSFQAGSVSVSGKAAAETAAASAALRKQAEDLMAPYAPAGDFSFRGVRA
jgi:hypothetical protein